MIRIGSVEDVKIETGAEQPADETSAWSWPQVPKQRGSVESGSTTS